MTDEGKHLLERIFQTLKLSARSYDRLIKVARTIADLAGSDIIEAIHLSEAVSYRDNFQKR